jgi:Polyketide cyclase / dehydrase and lipid transport
MQEQEETTAKGVLAGVAAGIAQGLIGFAVASTSHGGMGLVMFLLIPLVSGIPIGWMVKSRKAVGISALISLFGSLLLLIALGKEGPLCALMAFPLLLVCILAGVLIGAGLRMAFRPRRSGNTISGMLIVAGPLLIFGGKQVESPLLEHARIEVISNSVHIADTPEHVWTHIQSIDSVKGSKPWLMYVGLPVPQKCTLEKTAEGARRTCYFDKGYIEETVTTWDPPLHMGLRIDRTHMPGRHWLGFEHADYWLQAEGNGTRLTRTTSVSSRLYPAWYWRPLERWGVDSEHRYILEDARIEGTAH